MPKPFPTLTGNGCHMHISLWSKDGKNLFEDSKDPMGLSKLGYQFIAGLMHSAEGLSAITNPTVNSYKRINAPRTLSGASWSPNTVTYTGNNRTHMIRIPDAGRFEFRLADGAANPYAMEAAVLTAGLEGIEQKRDPGERLDIDMYAEGHKVTNAKKLPLNLLDALRALEASSVLRQGLGRALHLRLPQAQACRLERICRSAHRVGAAHHARLLASVAGWRAPTLQHASGQILGFAALPSRREGPFSRSCQKKSSGLSIQAGVVRRDGRARDSGHRTPGSATVGETTMRFMILVKATKDSEAGVRPPEELFAAMADYHEQLVKAGVLLDASGLQPSSKGWRVKYSGGKRTVIDGPFTEAKELVAGYTMIQVKSREEALEWSRRFPNPTLDGSDCEIEVRQLFELEDFGESEAIDRFREMGLGGAELAAPRKI